MSADEWGEIGHRLMDALAQEGFKNRDIIQYCGQPMGVGCDGRCDLAIGIDWCLNDGKTPDLLQIKRNGYTLAELRSDPGSSEGDERKMFNDSGFPNKWCVRQCERCKQIGERDVTADEDPAVVEKRRMERVKLFMKQLEKGREV